MNTSMRDIGEQAGVSLGSLYQYFPDKEALLKAVILNNCLEIKAAFQYISRSRDTIKALKQLVDGYIDDVSERKELALLLEIYAAALRDDTLLAHIQQYDEELQLLTDILQQAKNNQQLSFQLPAALAASSILALLESHATRVAMSEDYSRKQAKLDCWTLIQHTLSIDTQW